MNTFFKTFFTCLILTFGFLAYKYFSVDSYSADLNVSKNNPVFGIHKEVTENKNIKQEEKVHQNPSKQEENKQESAQITKQKFLHTCYFYSNSGNLVLIKRELTLKPSLENSIALLLKGPMISETKKGIYSEIPANVDLINIQRTDKDIIVNLSSNFGNGGGSKSIQNRVMQLSKTVKLHEPYKNVYLYINGKEVEYLGGDGVYIKQPLD